MAARARVSIAVGVFPAVGFSSIAAHYNGSMRSSPGSALSTSLP
jgi:hypothetical protein